MPEGTEVQHPKIFTTHECVHLLIAGMLLTDLKARMVESADEVRGISDILLQRVSGGSEAPAGCEVKLVGVRWMYVDVHVQNATEYTAANCIVSMPHSVHMVCMYVEAKCSCLESLILLQK